MQQQQQQHMPYDQCVFWSDGDNTEHNSFNTWNTNEHNNGIGDNDSGNLNGTDHVQNSNDNIPLQ
eukprot:scaffold9447_cov18-Prasinocladus_malaysianus.AAC.1